MHPLFEQLLTSGVVLTDGAWGTELQGRGLPAGEIADAWNLTHPEVVEAVARAYIEAGSRIILTNTFQANRVALAPHGLAGRIVEINRAGAAISKRAAGKQALVFASVGPTGKLLMLGDVSEDELLATFREQIEGLAAGGADAIVVETMSDPAEAALAVTAARRVGLPVVASMCFGSGKVGDRTMTGATPEQAARELAAAGADAIGANCGSGIAAFVPICRRLHTATDRPIWIKANAGLPEVLGDRTVYRTTPEEFASHVPSLVAAGATFIGGCCGTSPAFIRAAAEALHARAGGGR